MKYLVDFNKFLAIIDFFLDQPIGNLKVEQGHGLW